MSQAAPVKPVQISQGGSSELGRVSEYLEESPRLLARPFPPKSWDVSRRAGCLAGGGFKGAEADIPDSRRKLSSLWRITRQKPVFGKGAFTLSRQPV